MGAIEVRNLDRLARKLGDTSRIDLEVPMRISAYIVENNAKRFAPVDTGRLRNEIKNKVTKERGSVEGKIGHFEPMLEYAPFQEWGTSKMAGQPFLRPGWAASRQTVKRVFEDYVRKELSKIRK